ncbi:hypothetical protein [Streptomyces spectabilis]|uniref:Uncharacterized protein n=1 Tax=Streptomyces spectabilis TaxID=68270 RepID=A0A516RF83_STRST|nr:hypothetical protein [Streptomyces spectabilis]QDQ14320.1 hypothetical protein FH965_30215 [Streptomyces spectabilis]
MSFTSFNPLSLPDIRTNDITLIQRDGLWAGNDYMGGRTVALSLEVQAVNAEEFGAAVNLITQAFSPAIDGEARLSFQIPGLCNGRSAYINVRTRRRSAPLDASFARLSCAFEIELFATDPIVYASEESAATLRNGVPARFSVDGSRPVTPTITYSSVSDPKVLNALTGESVGATLAPGEHFLELSDPGAGAAASALIKFRDTWV